VILSGASYGFPRRGACSDFFLAALALSLLSRAANAELSQRDLAQVAKQGIENNSVMYDPPRVSVDGQTLDYNPGKVFYPGYAPKPSQPLGFPTDIQLKIEILRKHRAKEKEELRFLEPYFARMERLVAEDLTLIKSHRGNQKELVKQLNERDVRAQAVLKEAIQKWAAHKGLTLGGEQYGAAVIPSVKITTVPAGGTVYFLNAVDYNVYKQAGALNQLDKWNQVPGEQMDMGGAYYFRASWPGGKTKQTAKILIDKDQTISLRVE